MKVEEGVDGESATEKFSRDLLQRFSLCPGGGRVVEKSSYKSPNKETEELELSLGLSLGGKFGIEKSTTRLVRSVSVAGALPSTREDDLGSVSRMSGSFPSIIRTSSLLTEAEEEFRKRKEWQSLRRLEAKRRRCEKQKKVGEKDCGDEIEGRSTSNFMVKDWVLGNGRVPDATVMPLPFGMPCSATIAGQGLIGVDGVGEVGSKGKEGILGVGSYGLVGFGMVSAGGSVEAQHGNSSGSGGGSDLDGRPTQGSSTSYETMSPATNGLSPSNKPSMGTPKEGIREILPRQDALECKPKVQGAILTEDNMPCVFTKGQGPNGIRVDGILYKYGKGEEVRIMCTCHGKFLSPAEFVRHAGGGDVANPLRHIFINTSTLLSR